MPTNDYQEKAASYAEHEIQGTLKLAYKEFGRIFEKYVKEGNVALDYGSGTGRSTRYLRDIGFQADGVDIDPTMLDKARESSRDITYYPIVNDKIPIRNSKYDLIFSTLVILEIPTIEQMRKVTDEMYRVMKLNGTAVLLTVNDDFYSHDWVSVDTNYPENVNPKSGQKLKIKIKEINLELYDYYWTREDYRKVFTDSHFEVVEELLPKVDKGDKEAGWLDERNYFPYVIFVLQKKMSLINLEIFAKKQGLSAYCDGVYFKETQRSQKIIKKEQLSGNFNGDRNEYSGIELVIGARSMIPFHKLISYETYQHLYGKDAILHLIYDNGKYKKVWIGEEAETAVKTFTVVPGTWQAIEVEGERGFASVRAKVVPGFHPDDSEPGDLPKLSKVSTDPVAIKVVQRFMFLGNKSAAPKNNNNVQHHQQEQPSLRSRL